MFMARRFRTQVHTLPDGHRIVAIHSSDATERLRKFVEAKAVVDKELGCTPELPSSWRAFLYLAPGSARMVGMAVAEPLSTAYRLVLPDVGAVGGEEGSGVDAMAATDAATDASRGEVLRHDGVRQPAMCGISHIWVDESHRRSGVARQLVDAVRRNMATGFEVPTRMLAFSQPTTYGRAFAAAYTGTATFLVYTD